MNKLERVRAALAGAPVDRVPAGFWFHFPQAEAHGAASVKAHLSYYLRSGIDFLKVMNEHPYEANVEITAPSDWLKLRPAPVPAPFYAAQLDEVKRIVDDLAEVSRRQRGLFLAGAFIAGAVVGRIVRDAMETMSREGESR